MKNQIKFCAVFFIALLSLNSCSTDDKVVDQVQSDVTNGAVLRALNDTEENDPVIQGANNTWTVELEEQDVEDGALMQQVNVYVKFNDNTILSENSITGAGTDFTFPVDTEDPLDFEDVLLRTITPDEFSTDTPFGLPRIDLVITEADLVTVLDNSTWNSTDTVTVRLELVLTDGRVFSTDNAAGIITGFGSFFSSPFQHTIVIDSGIGINYLDEDNNFFTPGFNNNYFVLAEITDQEMGNNIQTVNVYKRFVDNTIVGDVDLTVPEALIQSFSDGDFGTSPDGFPTIEVNLTEDEILDGLSETDDIAIGDVFYIRYEVITNDGRVITNENAGTDFYDAIDVTDCPFPPLDEEDSFVGGYDMTQVVSSIFGYDTFGPSTTVFSGTTDASQEEPGIAMNVNQRSFDGEYLFALGFGNPDTYVMEYNLCKVSISDGMGPIDGSTGVWCGNVAGIKVGFADGGVYDASNDSEFTLAILDDIEGECGDAGATTAQILFTKQ